jgi:hypothetical protein
MDIIVVRYGYQQGHTITVKKVTKTPCKTSTNVVR